MLKKTKINQKIKNAKFCFLIQQQAFFFAKNIHRAEVQVSSGS